MWQSSVDYFWRSGSEKENHFTDPITNKKFDFTKFWGVCLCKEQNVITKIGIETTDKKKNIQSYSYSYQEM